jgi:hypothetical protein
VLGCTVDEALARMDSREYTGWLVYERLYGPLGPERQDYLFAQVCATLYNVNRSKGKKAASPVDYAPPWADRKAWPWAEPKQEQTPEEMLRAIKTMTRGMGGKVAARGDS